MIHPRVESEIARVERAIEAIDGSLSATERRKVAMLILSSPQVYRHDGFIDINLARAHARSIADHVWPKHPGVEYPTNTRGTGASVRETLDAAVQKTQRKPRIKSWTTRFLQNSRPSSNELNGNSKRVIRGKAMSNMELRIDKLESQDKSLGEKFEEAIKAYQTRARHPSIEAQFKSIANRSVTFKKDFDEIRAAEPISLGKLVELETEARELTQAVDSLRRTLGLSPIIDEQLAFLNQRGDRGFAA